LLEVRKKCARGRKRISTLGKRGKSGSRNKLSAEGAGAEGKCYQEGGKKFESISRKKGEAKIRAKMKVAPAGWIESEQREKKIPQKRKATSKRLPADWTPRSVPLQGHMTRKRKIAEKKRKSIAEETEKNQGGRRSGRGGVCSAKGGPSFSLRGKMRNQKLKTGTEGGKYVKRAIDVRRKALTEVAPVKKKRSKNPVGEVNDSRQPGKRFPAKREENGKTEKCLNIKKYKHLVSHLFVRGKGDKSVARRSTISKQTE